MPQTLSNSSTSENNDQGRRRHPYLLVELVVIIVVTGALLWILHNYPPRGPIAQGLLNTKLWILVLLASTVGTAGSLIPYYVGQQGTQAIFAHYPKIKGKPWARLEATFRKFGAPALTLSIIPGLGAVLLAAAGAFGIRRWVFLCWVFVGKILRYWVLAFAILFALEMVG